MILDLDGASPLATQLATRATGLEDHLLSKKLATEAEIAACYDAAIDDRELRVALAYADLRVLLFERSPDKESKSARLKQADRVILDALRGASKTVRLTDPIDETRELKVYPKSLNTLVELAERDGVTGFFTDGMRALRSVIAEHPSAERTEQYARAVREVVYQTEVCVWIVTHPGPGLPFDSGTAQPDLPAWVDQLSPVDVLQVFHTHHEVNAGRLGALQALPSGRKNSDSENPRGWGVFLANMSSLLDRSAEELARDYSLAALFAQSYVHAVEQERAMENAKESR